jgi:hypothetical protein
MLRKQRKRPKGAYKQVLGTAPGDCGYLQLKASFKVGRRSEITVTRKRNPRL